MHRHDDGVQALLGRGGVHVDGDVGGGGGVVEDRPGAGGVQGPGDAPHVAEHAADVGGGRERADLQGAIGEGVQAALEVAQIDGPLGGQPHLGHVGHGLQPGQLVGVVLVGPHQHHRAAGRGDGPGELILALQRLGHPQADHPHQLVQAAVAPEPTNSTTSSAAALTERSITRRASSRRSVISRPVEEMAVWVLA